MGSGERPRRPGPLKRWLFRAPVLMYRIGLGGLLLGQVMVTTVGRKSGQPRRAVVDLLKRDVATDTYYVVSAYGRGSDWYRNLEANPAVKVQARGRKFSARATTLAPEEAEEVLLDYWRRHRLLARMLLSLVGLRVTTEEEARAAAAEMRVVAIRPEGEG